MRHAAIQGVFVAALALATPAVVPAQGLSVDVSAGRLVYDPVLANIGTNHLMGSLRYDSTRDTWVYGTAAAPLTDASTFWGGGGAGGRLATGGFSGVSAGADVDAHVYSFRDAVADQIGTGAIAEAVPFVRLSAGLGYVEGRAGWRGHTQSFSGVRDSRGVFETGALAGYGATLRIEGDARWVRASEGTFPFAGVNLAYNGAPVQAWGHVGKWLHGELDQATWGGGVAVSVGARSTVWASLRQEAPDPLFWNTTRRTWSVGMTHRLGRVAAPIRVLPASQAGSVLVTVRVNDAPPGPVSIAGDFNNWQPAPMQREGDRWIVRLPIGAGVYHYSFRSAAGNWFVPSSTPGRRDDGMGGHVAVLLVN